MTRPNEIHSEPADTASTQVELSIVIPVYNEIDNLQVLQNRIVAAMNKIRVHSWEVILVNDGSTDGSADAMDSLVRKDRHFKAIHLNKNCGQSAAFDAGFRYARYPIVATMDADLQNDPFDYSLLLPELGGKVGAVCGIRVNRNDSRGKKIASRIANWIRNRLTQETITDTGCSLKVFKREALNRVKLLDGMHRFLPTLIKMEGYRVIEVPVGHHPRYAGSSKYATWKRGWTAFFDLLAVRWMQKRKLNYQMTESPLKKDESVGNPRKRTATNT